MALHGTALEVSDPDAGAGDVKLELEADFGVIDATAATTGTDVSVSDEGVVTLTGTIAEISDLLAGNGGAELTYTANSDSPPSYAELTLTINDQGNTGAGGPEEDTEIVQISVEGVNDAPVITTSTSRDDPVLVVENTTDVTTVTATDSDVPAQTLTFSIAGGPSSAHFNITPDGVLTFKVAPDFENPADDAHDNDYTLNVRVDDGNGGSDTEVIWVRVTDSQTGTVATELHGGQPTSNRVVLGVASSISVAPGNTLQLVTESATYTDPSTQNVVDVEFTASDGATPDAGSFNPNTTREITLGPAGTTHTVKVGTDADGDGDFDTFVPYWHTLTVQVIDFANAGIVANRTAAAGDDLAEDPYPIKENERFDVGSPFRFALKDVTTDGPSLIRIEISTGLDESGEERTHTFEGPADSVTVAFYVDANDSEDWESGEPRVESEAFTVAEVEQWNLSVEVSQAITDAAGVRQTLEDVVFKDASNRLLRKDGEDDWRATGEFVVHVFGTFPPSDNRPDPAPYDVDVLGGGGSELDGHFDSPAHIVYVDEIEEVTIDPPYAGQIPGICRGHNWRQILIDWNAEDLAMMAAVLAHEMGHGVDLEHLIDGEQRPTGSIMKQGPPWSKNKLNSLDADRLSPGN